MKSHRHLIAITTKNAFILFLVILGGTFILYKQGEWIAENRPRFRRLTSIERIPCEYCAGSGLIDDETTPSGYSMCPICFGLGANLIRKMDDNDKLCPACGGMGRIYDFDTDLPRTCGRCDGRGLIHTRQPEE
ncbi:MAG: hypothetical protein EOM20_12560 [Spartobacteria bacterium]|nr:hypothetical protein [Spartobacteria bacterium]